MAVATLTLALLVAAAAPVSAGGIAHTNCDNEGCDATASSSRERTNSGGHRRASSPLTCQYRKLDVPPDAVFYRPDGSPLEVDGTGRWFERDCVDARDLATIQSRYANGGDEISRTMALVDSVRAVQRQPLYLRPAVIPDLVEEARSRLEFPVLNPKFAPASPWTFVNYPTALWLDGDLTAARSASAEVPGVRVVVSATVTEVRWETGDGGVEVCRSGGRAPDSRVPGDHGDCSHVWAVPSIGQPGGFPVGATVFWRVVWSVDGAPGGGDLGVIPQRSPGLRVPVAEIQIVNTPTGN
jgi:hypothetical protein